MFAATLMNLLLVSQGLLVEELPSPVLWWAHGNSLCSQVRAVDAAGVLYHDEGCENGRFTFDPIDRLSDAQMDSLERIFASLPVPPPPLSCTGGMAHQFMRRDGGEETYWTACGSSQVQGSVDGLDEPFLEAARIFGGVDGEGRQ